MKNVEVLPLSPGGRRYGRYLDNANNPSRIRLMKSTATSVVLPAKASVAQFMGFIRDQGQAGSCTGQLGAEITDLMYRSRNASFPSSETKSVTASNFEASAEFVYINNLIADGNLGQDAGSTIYQTFLTLHQYGSCLNSQEPYTDAVSVLSTPPTSAEYTEALINKLGTLSHLPNLREIKSTIASGYSAGIGLNVFTSFESNEMTNTGIMPMPNLSDQYLGGHAAHVVAYDDTKSFISVGNDHPGGVFIQNSWGSQWGISAPGRTDRGCYWMPYAYFDANVSDCWSIGA